MNPKPTSKDIFELGKEYEKLEIGMLEKKLEMLEKKLGMLEKKLDREIERAKMKLNTEYQRKNIVGEKRGERK